jgi:transmembrane sensor
MPATITYEACVRYLRGEASLAEARAVRAWLADPANAAQAQAWMSRSVAEAVVAAPAATDAHNYNYAQMRATLHARLGMVSATPTQPKPRRWQRWAAAAAVAGGLVGTVGLWQRSALPSKAITAYHATGYGQTQEVRLPDGSVVTLNAHSSVRYVAPPQASAPREVWLDGEAFFAVKHLPSHQHFVVHTTAGFRVEVLGTRFAVYRRHAQGRVVLLSGKVRVAFADSTRPAVVLKPGELLQTSDKHPRALVHKAVQATTYTSWTANELRFEATPLADLATRLRDTYGVEVVVADPALRRRKFTGTFPIGNLEVLCEDLAEAFHLHIERQQNRLVLASKALPD